MQTENPLFRFDSDENQISESANPIKLLIGIDPDCQKSGFASYQDKDAFTLHNYTFFEIFDRLHRLSKSEVFLTEVFIEAGWLNKSNWHKITNGSAAINANIGLRTGVNHEVGRKIVEMCEYLGLKHHLIKPTKSKVNAETFKAITKYQGRTNQEQRDSAMLVWNR